MKLSQIIQKLELWAPSAYQESYDNSRLLVGDSQMEVTGILVSLDCIESVVDEAIAKKCNVVIAHHPIIFGGLKSLNGKSYIERTVIKAIKNDVAIYAIHTNLDNVHTGVNKKIADLIGLKNTRILSTSPHKLIKLEVVCPIESANVIKNALFEFGVGDVGGYKNASFAQKGQSGYLPKETAQPTAGSIGEYQEREELKLEFTFASYLQYTVLSVLKKVHPYEEFDYKLIALQNENQLVGAGMIGDLEKPENITDFLLRIKSTFNCGIVKHTQPIKPEISRIALCGGAGFFLLKSAIAQQADVYITSDVKYHEFFDADGKIVLTDIGHYESEQFTKDLIVDYLKLNFPQVNILLSDAITNPVYYI